MIDKIRPWMIIVGATTLVALVFILGACASALTEDQKEEKAFDKDQARSRTIEQFYTCKAYKEMWHQPWIDNTSTATRLKKRQPGIQYMKIQMGLNNCGRLLRALELD